MEVQTVTSVEEWRSAMSLVGRTENTVLSDEVRTCVCTRKKQCTGSRQPDRAGGGQICWKAK